MTFDVVSMSGENPPPYSAVAATPLAEPPDSPDTTLPFSHSNRLSVNIIGLVSEGQTLDSRFKDICDVASAGAEFEYQATALILCKRFETLVWESRDIAGVALVAIKDFNEIVLDFLSDPSVAVQDRLKELANVSKLLQRERDSAKNQKSSFDVLIKELEDFHRMIYSESAALNPKRQRQTHSGGKGVRGTRPLQYDTIPLFIDSSTGWDDRSSKSRLPFAVPRSEPLSCVSTTTVCRGAISRTGIDYTLQFERMAEKAGFPSFVSSPREAQATSPLVPNSSQRKRLCPPIEYDKLAALPGTVSALVRDLGAFTSRVEVFNTIFAELAREQDIIVVYLKDGQSNANQGYKSEINRLRRHLPCVCSALDAYSKGRVS